MDNQIIHPPFIHNGKSVLRMTVIVMVFLTILAVLYSFVADKFFIIKFIFICLLGSGLELSYNLLVFGKIKFNLSSMISSALLVLSIPAGFSNVAIFYALIISILIIRCNTKNFGIYLNPMLAGRLFLMFVYGNEIEMWQTNPVDALTYATPLEIYKNEDFKLTFLNLMTGHVTGSWEGTYHIINGSPGEIFNIVLILMGIVLSVMNLIKWRISLWFILSFCLTNFFTGRDVLYNLFTGAVLFSAVFIAGDPKSTPSTTYGMIAAGIIAGIANALIRKYTYYPEGIVFAFLIVNVLAAPLDNLFFYLRSLNIKWKTKRKQKS